MAATMKKTETRKAMSDTEALEIINQFRQESLTEPYEVTKASYALHTKKSKGEIVDAWYTVDVTLSYEE